MKIFSVHFVFCGLNLFSVLELKKSPYSSFNGHHVHTILYISDTLYIILYCSSGKEDTWVGINHHARGSPWELEPQNGHMFIALRLHQVSPLYVWTLNCVLEAWREGNGVQSCHLHVPSFIHSTNIYQTVAKHHLTTTKQETEISYIKNSAKPCIG